MNVFGTSQAGETKKIISNLEQTIKSYSNKFDKIEHFLEETYKSVQIQEEQTEKLELTCLEITDHMSNVELLLTHIQEKIEDLNKIIPAILSRLNTIETYYKDKP
jgi:tRNA U34 5-carboxymethylaminomethyl modifying GTPase MnmE/TrmE|uniref:Uncharacterized protein n=1 Tax=Schizaphis graminum TaxID=13262 RepID=A0A2S2PQ17_SCHGA